MGRVRNILLTGANGYLGSHLLKALLNNRFYVTILLRKTSDDSRINDLLTQVYVEYLPDVNLEDIIKKQKIDTIIHTATNYGRKGEILEQIVDGNLNFPLKLLNAAVNCKVSNFINTDTVLLKFTNAYSLTKKQFLDWLIYFKEDINVLNVELEYFYGPNDDDSKFINKIFNQFFSNTSSIDFTEGTQQRDFVFIDDVIDAYLIILQNLGQLSNLQNIPVGSGKPIIIRDLVEKIRRLCNITGTQLNFGALANRKNELFYSTADITVLRAMGWEPRFNIDKGLNELLKAHKRLYDQN